MYILMTECLPYVFVSNSQIHANLFVALFLFQSIF